MNHANQFHEELKKNSNTRNKEKHPIILNDIVKLKVQRINNSIYINDEINPQKWKDHDLFVPTKITFLANFRKFCHALGINSVNFNIGKS